MSVFSFDSEGFGEVQEDPSIWRIEGDNLIVNPHEGQVRLFESLAMKIAVIAGNQSGKTVSGPLWLLREIKKRGPGEYGVVCPTFSLMDKKTLPEFKKLFEKDGLNLGKYIDSKKEFRFSRRGLFRMFGTDRYPSGNKFTVIVRFGYAENPDSLESMTLKGLWCDESGQDQFKLGSFQALNRRCNRYHARQLHTTTPYNLGALKTQLYDPWKAGDKNIEVITFSSIMNPYFSQEIYDYNKSILPDWKFQLLYNGIFTRPTGQIYDIYNDRLLLDDGLPGPHRVKRFAIPQHWFRIWGFDFGNVNTACIKIAVNPDWEKGSRHPHKRRFYVYSSYRTGNKSTNEHVKALMASERAGFKFTCVGGSSSEDDWRSKWGRSGIYIKDPEVNSVEVGIDSVYELLAKGELVFFDDLEAMDEEMKSYSRKLDDNDEATDEIDKKATFHRCDGLRYACSEICYNAAILLNLQENSNTGWTEEHDHEF